MEIYSFYQMAILISGFFAENDIMMLALGVIGGALLWLSLFLLQGFGLYAMAKKVGLKKKGLAFVPFANIWYIGKLAGECNFFGQKMKRAGLYAMIMQILGTALCLLTIAAQIFLWVTYGAPEVEMQTGIPYWPGLKGFGLSVSKFYEISDYILSIVQLVYEIFMVVLVMGLYKKYTPKNYTALGMLTLFVPVSRFIIIFALRKRQPIDYEAYMRARYDAYMRRQQQYYNQYGRPNNPYGAPPYGNPYGGNPYGNNSYGQNNNAAPPKGDPFEEFSSDKKGKGTDEPFEEMNSDSDGFFN